MKKFFMAVGACLPLICSAADVAVVGGFFSISDFLSWNRPARVAYITGILDGAKTAAVWGASGERYQKLLDCTSPMSGNQLLAVAEKHFNQHPEMWHTGVNQEFIPMIYKACKL